MEKIHRKLSVSPILSCFDPLHIYTNYFFKIHFSSWLRHYATSQKVVGSIPGDVIGFFNWPNPSSHTIALESTQPLTEI
jgi:hypothetical protein